MTRNSAWGWLAAGLAVRLLIAPLGAHPGDFVTLTGWANAIQAQGWLNSYAASDANYPPLALALLGGSRGVYGLFAAGDPSGPLWLILLKLPAILADLGIAWVVRPHNTNSGQQSAVSHWLPFVSMVFNPALIYLSAWWGQFESVYALCALMGLLDASGRRPFWAGVWLALGVMVKLQAAVVAPVVIISWVRARGLSPLRVVLTEFAAGLVLPLALLLGPFVLTGQGSLVGLRLVALVGSPSWLTVNALNVWYLVTGGAGNWRFNAPLVMPDTAPILFGASAWALGLMLLAGWMATVLAILLQHRARRDSELGKAEVYVAAALLYLGVFLFPTQSHERYAFGAVVMLAAGLTPIAGLPHEEREPRAEYILYAALGFLHTINLMWAAPFEPGLQGWFAGNPLVGIVTSALFCAVALYSIIRFALAASRTSDDST